MCKAAIEEIRDKEEEINWKEKTYEKVKREIKTLTKGGEEACWEESGRIGRGKIQSER